MQTRTLRWVVGVFAVLLAASFALPTATATFVPKHEFTTGLPANEFGNDTQENPFDRLAFVTGRLVWDGDSRGVFAFSDAASFQGLTIDRLDVYNQSAIQDAQQGRARPTGPVFQQFFDVSIRATAGSSLFLVPDDVGIAYSCQSDFSITTFLQLPPGLFDASEGTINGTHLMSSGQDQTCDLQQSGETLETFLALLNENSTIVVDPSGDDPKNFTGTDWLFQVRGTPSYDARADGVLAPFQGTAGGLVTAYGGTDVSDRFSIEPMQRMLENLVADDEDANADPDGQGEDDPLDSLRQIAPVLDGVLLGNLSQPVTVDGEPFRDAGWAFFRFDRMELAAGPAANEVSLAGESRLILVDGELYDERNAIHFGPLHVPVLSVILWVMAAGAIFASYSLKPLVGASNVKSFGLIRLLGFIFHILALVAAFILFDVEIKAVLGTSLLTILFTGGGGQGVSLGIVAFFQLLPFGLAALFFGLPMRFIANAALRFGGLNSAKGFGKGVGNLATWGLGAIFLRVLLGGFLALALDIMSGLAPGG